MRVKNFCAALILLAIVVAALIGFQHSLNERARASANRLVFRLLPVAIFTYEDLSVNYWTDNITLKGVMIRPHRGQLGTMTAEQVKIKAVSDPEQKQLKQLRLSVKNLSFKRPQADPKNIWQTILASVPQPTIHANVFSDYAFDLGTQDANWFFYVDLFDLAQFELRLSAIDFQPESKQSFQVDDLKITDFYFKYRDQQLASHILQTLATQHQMDPEAYRFQLVEDLKTTQAQLEDPQLQRGFLALQAFIVDPQQLRVSAHFSQPIELSELLRLTTAEAEGCCQLRIEAQKRIA